MPTAPAVDPGPLPRIRAFEQMGFGLFLHWGLYSQLGQGEWVWNYHENLRATYQDLTKTFTAADFDADRIVRSAKSAGATYICLTTRHHEGFSLYDTHGLNTYDAPHSAAKRDLVREYSDACERHGMGKFFYHTTLDWWHPDFDAPGRWDAYLEYLRKSVEVLCTHYGKVDGLWFDGNWARKDRDWQEDALYGMIRRHQPETIIVNNSSTKARGAEGHPEVDVLTFEQGKPTPPNRRGKPKWLAGEMCDTINSHWGIGAHDLSHKSPADIIDNICSCRRFGANYLMNIGPTAQGGLPGYESELLALVGRWMSICPDAIYSAEPTVLQCRNGDFVLKSGATYYYFCRNLPIKGNMHLHAGESGAGPRTVVGTIPAVKRIAWCDEPGEFVFHQEQGRGWLTFDATPYPYGKQLIWRIARIETAG